jgi:hypothetical protein
MLIMEHSYSSTLGKKESLIKDLFRLNWVPQATYVLLSVLKTRWNASGGGDNFTQHNHRVVAALNQFSQKR